MSLKAPARQRHSLPLHEHPDVLADAIRQNEPPRLVASIEQPQTLGRIPDLQVGHRREELVIGDAEGEEELRLPIEQERGEAFRFAGTDQVGEVDVRRQILLAGIRQEIARDPLTRVRGRRSEPADARIEQLLLGEAIVEGDEEAALDAPRQIAVVGSPVEGDVGELPFLKLDSALGEVGLVVAGRLALCPVELAPLPFPHPQLVQTAPALDQPRGGSVGPILAAAVVLAVAVAAPASFRETQEPATAGRGIP